MAKKSAIFLNLLKNLTPKKIEDIIDTFCDTDQIFNVSPGELEKVISLNRNDIDTILKYRSSDVLADELKRIEDEEITVIDIFDEAYPALLKEISHPPIVLYTKGELSLLSGSIFAIVGTRIPTIYGLKMAEDFSARLASMGIFVISGLARGIDTAAHKGALKAGKTIAVLGSGLLNVYPRENKTLAQAIVKNGLLISEFPLLEPPLKENFPRRNRIVSGLSKGVLVVEAAEKSGALITAHCALEQNREVFALPGKVDSPLSKGAHILIKEGAKLVDSVADILDELNIKIENIKPEEKNINLDTNEKSVFNMITDDGVYLEEIILKSDLPQQVVNKIILNLQLNGFIKEIKPAYFTKLI